MGANPYMSSAHLRVNGYLYLHAVPVSVVSHLQWIVESMLTLSAPWSWTNQPLIPKSQKTFLTFRCNLDSLPKLVSALYEFPNLFAEVIREPVSFGLGERWMITPVLGIKRVDTNELGNVVLDESVVLDSINTQDPTQIPERLAWAIGRPWDQALEPLRIASAATNTTLLASGS